GEGGIAEALVSKPHAEGFDGVRQGAGVEFTQPAQRFRRDRWIHGIGLGLSLRVGEPAGRLVAVLERFITYQKLALGVRKKVLVSLMYPSVLVVLVILLMVFLVTYVVPSFASL